MLGGLIINDSFGKNDIKNPYKKCPKCNGSGKDLPFMNMMIDFPEIKDKDRKKPNDFLFKCKRCNGSGKIPLVEPLMRVIA